MEIIKNKKVDGKTTITQRHLYLIDALAEGKNFSEISKKYHVTRQATHFNFVKVCNELEIAEPKLKKLYSEFDTFLDVNKYIEKSWVAFVVKMIIYKNKNTCVSHLGLKGGLVLDKKLDYFVKQGELKSLNSGAIHSIVYKESPITIDLLAEKLGLLGLNVEKIRLVLNRIVRDLFFVLDNFIVHSSKESFHIIIKKYCFDKKINYSGTLKEFYEKMFLTYPTEMKNAGFYSYEKFIIYIKRNYHVFSDFIVRLKNDRSYELLRYAKKHNIELYQHHLLKSSKEKRVFIDAEALDSAIKNSGYTITEITKIQPWIFHWRRGVGKHIKKDIEKVANFLNVDIESLIAKEQKIIALRPIPKGRVRVNGEIMKKAIKNSPLTSVDISKRIHKSQPYISNLCKNSGTVANNDIKIIAKMLKVKVDDLIYK